MGLKDRRRIIRTGRYSRAITIPAKLKIGEEATLAGDRILLIDPRGEIPEDELLEFLERIVEPELWMWLREREKDG